MPTLTEKIPLSAVIISFQAGSTIGNCLDSLSFADEIIVVDSGSTDDTIPIAQRANARVIQQAWLGFGRQKQFAIEQAKHDWVLCLDTDEVISETLSTSISNAVKAKSHLAYMMPRCNRFMGRWLKHGEGYPDWSTRLFDRRHARWSEDVVHEKVITSAEIGKLSGDLLHHSADDLPTYLSKQNTYTSLQAENLWKAGKSISAFKLIASPILRFFKFYLIRQGFLDGIPGLIHISIGCFNSFIKYAKLYELKRKQEDR